jgi:hypothetical protein
VHVYGAASPETRAVCDPRHLSLHLFPWTAGAARAGLARDAVYLARPDGYVAFAGGPDSATAIASHLDDRQLTA